MAVSSTHKGWDLNDDRTELRVLFNGTERVAIDATGIGFFQAAPVAKQAALTAADGGTVDATYGTAEADVINNLVTRVGELETALVNLGLITSA